MNGAATIQATPLSGPGRRGPALGWSISLLVHALAVGWLLHAAAPDFHSAEVAPEKRIEVRLAPPRPAPAGTAQSAPRDAAPVRPAPRKPAHAAPRPQAHPPVIAVAPAPAHAPAHYAPTLSVAPAPADTASTPAPDSAAPRVDLAAARSTARMIAREEGKSLVALPKRKPVVAPNAEHQSADPIENARRGDCKTAYAGMGLLAVIPLAIDAVRSAAADSGCKW